MGSFLMAQESRVDILLPVIQNDGAMADRSQFLEDRIQSIKHEIALWAICVRALCRCNTTSAAVRRARCKADPPLKHGPYPQISFNWHGKSTTQSVRADEVDEVRQQLKNYPTSGT